MSPSIWANMKPCFPTVSACLLKNTKSENAFVVTSRRLKTARMARKSSFPGPIRTLCIDEARKRVKIMVSEDQLSLAIGKRGQNARLTSKLSGWQVDIEAEHVATMGFEEKMAQAVQSLAAIPGITEEQARVLVKNGLTSLEIGRAHV